jgi:hypothetical protein
MSYCDDKSSIGTRLRVGAIGDLMGIRPRPSCFLIEGLPTGCHCEIEPAPLEKTHCLKANRRPLGLVQSEAS